MTAILAVQALVFQDGGLLALGANVFNMAIAGVWAGYLPFRLLGSGTWRSVGVFLGGALSVLVASSLALAELRLSGVPMPGAVVGLSMGLFALSALIEGAITLAVFQAVERMNRGWVRPGPESPKRAWGLLATAALALASVGAVFASALPDGLEKLAEELGIASRAINLLASPLAEYELRAADNPWLRKAGAGLIGLAVVFLVCAAAGRLLVGKRARGTA
jgi:cobalt/nickel transport system permease protein